MIYDPRRRALDLRQAIIELMTAEEIEEYARRVGEQPPTPETPRLPPKGEASQSGRGV